MDFYKKMRTGSLLFFASPEMSVCVCFEGQTIDILFAKYWIRRLRLGANVNGRSLLPGGRDVNGRSLPAIAR